MSDLVVKKAPVGSRERCAELGALLQELITSTKLLLESHVPDADERRDGAETRMPRVIATVKALECFQDGWKHLREAHGG